MAAAWVPADFDTFGADEPEQVSRSDTPAAPGSLASLLELIDAHRPEWMRDALCLEYPDLPWFPERGQSVAECKAVCERCPVIDPCGLYAAREGIKYGIWAGQTTGRRKAS